MVRVRSYASACALCLLFTSACSTGPPSNGTDTVSEADSVVAFLATVDFEPLRSAFDRLTGRGYSQYVRTAQFTRNGGLIAMQERVIRKGDGTTELRSADTVGSFSFGYLGRFVSAPDEQMDAGEVVEFIGEDEPPYLSPRNRDAYTYSLIEDAVLTGMSVDVVDVAARSDARGELAVRRARLYVERESGRLVGLYTERTDAALWYREASAYFVAIRRDPSGTWLPDRARFDTVIRLPLRPVQRFRRVLSYYDYDLTG